MLNLRVCKDWRATRLDRFLMFHFPGVPFNLIAQLVKKRAIRLKSKPSHINSLLEEGDQIVINSGFLKDHLRQTPTQIDIGQSRALVEKMLVYEDEHFAVLNKPHGISCQSGGFNKTQEMKNATNIADMVKPLGWRIPHRLDSGASGALILCKTHQAASLLSKVFKEHTLRMEHNAFKKTYLAVLNGIPKDQHGQVSLKIDEKRALSEFRVLYPKSSTRIIPGKNISVVELKLFTGRKHQLRIHCAEGLKCGILGDFLYSGKTDSSFYSLPRRLYLHCKSISIPLMKDDFTKEIGFHEIQVPVPEEFQQAIDMLK